MSELQRRAFVEEGGTMCWWDKEVGEAIILHLWVWWYKMYGKENNPLEGTRKSGVLTESQIFIKTVWEKKQLAVFEDAEILLRGL